MAQLTIGVKVNSGQLKSLGKLIDDISSKASDLNKVLSSLGSKTNPSGIKSTDAALSNLMNNAKESKNGVEKIAEHVNTSGLTGLDSILAQIQTHADSTRDAVGNIGDHTSTVGLDGINNKLVELIKVSQSTQDTISKLGQNVDTSGVDGLSAKIDGLASNIGNNLGGAVNTALSVIGGKSLSDLTVFNAMDKQINKVLIKNLGDSANQAESYWKTIDNATDNALISMRQAVPAINAIQRATQVNGTEMESASENVVAFGSYVQSLTGSSALAETAMYSLSKGIKGGYDSLDQYGITEESLKATGKWKGDEKDVKGFTDAVIAATGALEMQDQLLNTDKGKLTQIYKALSVEGAKMGEDLLSAIRPALDGFIGLNKEAGGLPAKLAVIGGVAVTGLASLDPLLNSINSIVNLGGVLKGGASKLGAGAKAAGQTATGMNLMSMSLTKMIAPMLKISAAIIIMLPVAAVIAAEAMILLRLLGELFKVLVFDKLDIGKSVDSIWDLAKGFGIMALAFGALTAVNITNIIYTATGGIAGTFLALTHFKETMAVSIPIINEIGNMPTISPAVGQKMQELGKAIEGIMLGIKSLSTVDGAVALAYISPFSDWTGNMQRAKDELFNAAKVVNELGDMPNINMAIVDKLKNTATALNSVSEAVKSLGNIDAVQTTWNPLTNFNNAIKSARMDIWKATVELRTMGSMPNIPEETATKLTNAKNALTSVAEAIKSLRTVDDSQQTWNPWTNFITAIKSARTDIWKAAAELQVMGDMPTIPKETAAKLENAKTSLSAVEEAIKSLSKIDDNQQTWNPWTNFITAIRTARSDIWAASGEVRLLADMPAIPEGTGAKIQRTAWTLNNVKTAIDAMKIVNDSTTTVDLSNIVSTITTARSQIWQVAGQLRLLADMPAIAGNVASKVNDVKSAAASVTQATNTLNAVPAPVGTNITKAVTTIKKAMDELNKLSGKKLTANINGIATSVTNAISKITSALNQGAGVQPAARNLGTKIGAGLKSGTNNLRSVANTAIQNGVNAISGKASAAWTAGSKVGSSAVAGFKSGLNSGSPGDIARIMEKEIGTYVPQLTWRQAPAVAAMMVRVSKEAVKAAAKGAGIGSPGDIAKMYKTEIGKYVPMMIRAGIPAVKQALRELGAVGTTEILKGLKISDVFKDMKMFRTVSNYFMDVVSKIQEVTKRTVASKSATQSYVQAWIDGAKKIKEAEKKAISESKKSYTSLMKLMKTSKDNKKKLVFDKKDIALLKAYTSTSSKIIKKNFKIATSGIKNKKVIKDIKSNVGAIGKAYKALNDSNYANDSAALTKMYKAYDSYYKKLDKAEKKKAKTSIDNIKKQIKEQQKAIKTAIDDMATAVADIKESALIEKNLRNIMGSQSEIEKYGQAVLKAQQTYDDYVFSMRARKKGETDSQWLKYQQDWVNQSNKFRAELEKQQLYLDEAIRKAEDYAIAMDNAADSTSALGDTKEDLMALAKAFNNVNKNTVDLNLNMSGMVDLVSKDPKFSGIDTSALQALFFDFLKKQFM